MNAHSLGMTLLAVTTTLSTSAASDGDLTVYEEIASITGMTNDELGGSVALQEPYLVVGAYQNFSVGPGYVRIYQRNAAGAWNQTQVLTGLTNGDQFGRSVAIDYPYLIVGAPARDIGSAADVGEIYVYQHTGGTWTMTQTISHYPTTSGSGAGDFLGNSLSLLGGHFLVNATRLGDGFVFEYTLNPTTNQWTQTQSIQPPGLQPGAQFGGSLSLDEDGDRFIVGAITDGPLGSGLAYVFAKPPGGSWTFQQQLTASTATAGDEFGGGCDIWGDWAIVGAHKNNGNAAGFADVFRWTGGTWNRVQTLTACTPQVRDHFGLRVAMWGETAVIGEQGLTVSGMTNAGGAQVYRAQGMQWQPCATLLPSATQMSAYFGAHVAIEGNTVAATAPQLDASLGGNEGMVGLFTLRELHTSVYGTGCGAMPPPSLSLSATPACEGGGELSLDIQGGPPGATTIVLLGFFPIGVSFPNGCTLLVGTPRLTLPAFPLDGLGAASIPVAVLPATPEVTIYLQAFMIVATAPGGYWATNGAKVSIE